MNEQCWNPPNETYNVCGFYWFGPFGRPFSRETCAQPNVRMCGSFCLQLALTPEWADFLTKQRNFQKDGRLKNGVYQYSEKKKMSDPVKGLFGVEHFAFCLCTLGWKPSGSSTL
jgi:hypothetical protein